MRREDDEPGEETSTLVEITLAAEGPRTRLRVIETGFQRPTWTEEDKARYADENNAGWLHELDELRDYAAGLSGSRFGTNHLPGDASGRGCKVAETLTSVALVH